MAELDEFEQRTVDNMTATIIKQGIDPDARGCDGEGTRDAVPDAQAEAAREVYRGRAETILCVVRDFDARAGLERERDAARADVQVLLTAIKAGCWQRGRDGIPHMYGAAREVAERGGYGF